MRAWPGRFGAPVLALALVLGGCGAGFGAGEDEGTAELVVSRDYGARVLLDERVGPVNDSSTALRLLDGEAEIETSYGGGFVDSIESVSSSSGTRSYDWFYFVNGIAAERGAAEFVVGPGDRMWWDHRDWTDAMDVNAVVGSFPAPMDGGYDGTVWPVSLECFSVEPACETVREQLGEAGVELAPGDPASGSGSPDGSADAPAGDGDTLRVLVGRWSEVAADEQAARLGRGPSVSGVFGAFVERREGDRLVGYDAAARAATDFGPHSGLIAAMRRGGEPPVWLVTGTDVRGVELAAAALDAGRLRNRYAAAVSPAGVSSLPSGGAG